MHEGASIKTWSETEERLSSMRTKLKAENTRLALKGRQRHYERVTARRRASNPHTSLMLIKTLRSVSESNDEVASSSSNTIGRKPFLPGTKLSRAISWECSMR